MAKVKDLTRGNIFSQIFKLATPIIGTSFTQMAYNLTDMMWLGKVGEEAVAAVGTAGFFVWFGISFLLIPRIGAEVGVSQSVGAGDINRAGKFARHALGLALVLSVLYSLVVYFMAFDLIGFFELKEGGVEEMGVSYLQIVSLAFVFTYLNPVFTGIYNGLGNSKMPFLYMLVGVVLNIVLDPILILGIGPIAPMGVEGAAWATFVSQFVVWGVFVWRFFIVNEIEAFAVSRFRFDKLILIRLVRFGFPVALESCSFAVFAIFVTRMLAFWGAIPVAVQSIGAQIEAVSWMTANGFATALGSFTGQNFGAGNYERIKKGFFNTLLIGLGLGAMVTGCFFFCGKSIFEVFFDDPESVAMGVVYLKILAISQVFMILEISSRGAFNGIGKPLPASITGILFTGLRVPASYLIMSMTSFGVIGIWWVISLSSVVKGLVLPLWFLGMIVSLGRRKNKK